MCKPILCLDFDGVIHTFSSGWQGIICIPDPPVPGALEFIHAALPYFRIAIYSSRSRQPAGIAAMQNWMREHGFPVDNLEFPKTKPAAMVTLDDRAITFDGNFPDIPYLLNFKPWHKGKD